MLKRFMNWLLYRLQKALGVISGRRKGNRSGTASRINASSEGYQLEGQSQEASSESAVYAPSRSTSGASDSEPSPFVEASQEPPSPSTMNTPVNPAIAEPDTHRRLNASSAALPGIETAVPSFPTDVSELVPSASSAANLSVSNEQLPEIHDLLPAVETDNSADTTPDDEADVVNASSSEVLNDEADIVSAIAQSVLIEPTTAELTTTESMSVEPTPPSGEMPELSPSGDLPSLSTEDPPAQAVLFSFDIIESDNLTEDSQPSVSDKERRAVQEIVQTSPTSEEVGMTPPAEVSTIETSVDHVRLEETAEHNEGEEASLLPDSDKPLEALSDGVSSELPQRDVDADEGHIERPREIEPLPYPWSLAVSKRAATPTADTLKQTDASFSPASVKSQGTESAEPALENVSVSAARAASPPAINTPEVVSKSGVVKLLFTLKPGNFHGYIVPNDGTQDILFHQKYINSDVFDRLERGAQVVVSVKHIEGKAYATKVDLQ